MEMRNIKQRLLLKADLLCFGVPLRFFISPIYNRDQPLGQKTQVSMFKKHVCYILHYVK